MKYLRHPIRSITEPYGKAGLLVAIFALVLAATGAAFAAVGLNGKQKKEVVKIAKQFAGKAGPAGPQGNPGAQGPAGANGKDGTNGKDGAAGPTGPTGSEGHEGPEGSPWTAGGILPPGSTETGSWVVYQKIQGTEEQMFTTISFPIPFALVHKSSTLVPVEIVAPGANTEHCTGSINEVKADPGYLCLYQMFAENVEIEWVSPPSDLSPFGAGPTGALFFLRATGPVGEPAVSLGTWALTGK